MLTRRTFFHIATLLAAALTHLSAAEGGSRFDLRVVEGQIRLGERVVNENRPECRGVDPSETLRLPDAPVRLVLSFEGEQLELRSRQARDVTLRALWDELPHARPFPAWGHVLLLSALYAATLAAFTMLRRRRRQSAWSSFFPWTLVFAAVALLSLAPAFLITASFSPALFYAAAVLLSAVALALAWKLVPQRDLTPEDEELIADMKIAHAFLSKGAPLSDSERTIIQASTLPVTVKQRIFELDRARRAAENSIPP